MEQLQQVLHHIEQRRKFVLTSHARPDGDAIGSVLALSGILHKMGKSAEIVMSDYVPVIYRPLPFSDTIVHASHVNGKYEAAILLECDSVHRAHIQGLEQHFLINIDHHLSSRPFAQVNWIDPNACATAEMIFRLGIAAGVAITPEIATCLYTAVLTDTGSCRSSQPDARRVALGQQWVVHVEERGNIAQNVDFARRPHKMHLPRRAVST